MQHSLFYFPQTHANKQNNNALLLMKINRIMVMDQTSEFAEELAIKNNTTKSICGYIVCGLCQYLAEQEEVTQELLKAINFYVLRSYIDKAMQSITKTRRMEIKKFMNKMNESEKKTYLTDWVANFQIADYLEQISDKVINHQLFFFRQSAYDHPQAMEKIKFEEAERVKLEEEFKGQLYFYTAFNPEKNFKKQNFSQELKKYASSKLPVIIATDVLGHFNTTVILQGKIFVLDSLPYVEGQYDSGITEAISYYHKISYLKS